MSGLNQHCTYGGQERAGKQKSFTGLALFSRNFVCPKMRENNELGGQFSIFECSIPNIVFHGNFEIHHFFQCYHRLIHNVGFHDSNRCLKEYVGITGTR